MSRASLRVGCVALVSHLVHGAVSTLSFPRCGFPRCHFYSQKFLLFLISLFNCYQNYTLFCTQNFFLLFFLWWSKEPSSEALADLQYETCHRLRHFIEKLYSGHQLFSRLASFRFSKLGQQRKKKKKRRKERKKENEKARRKIRYEKRRGVVNCKN